MYQCDRPTSCSQQLQDKAVTSTTEQTATTAANIPSQNASTLKTCMKKSVSKQATYKYRNKKFHETAPKKSVRFAGCDTNGEDVSQRGRGKNDKRYRSHSPPPQGNPNRSNYPVIKLPPRFATPPKEDNNNSANISTRDSHISTREKRGNRSNNARPHPDVVNDRCKPTVSPSYQHRRLPTLVQKHGTRVKVQSSSRVSKETSTNSSDQRKRNNNNNIYTQDVDIESKNKPLSTIKEPTRLPSACGEVPVDPSHAGDTENVGQASEQNIRRSISFKEPGAAGDNDGCSVALKRIRSRGLSRNMSVQQDLFDIPAPIIQRRRKRSNIFIRGLVNLNNNALRFFRGIRTLPNIIFFQSLPKTTQSHILTKRKLQRQAMRRAQQLGRPIPNELIEVGLITSREDDWAKNSPILELTSTYTASSSMFSVAGAKAAKVLVKVKKYIKRLLDDLNISLQVGKQDDMVEDYEDKAPEEIEQELPDSREDLQEEPTTEHKKVEFSENVDEDVTRKRDWKRFPHGLPTKGIISKTTLQAPITEHLLIQDHGRPLPMRIQRENFDFKTFLKEAGLKVKKPAKWQIVRVEPKAPVALEVKVSEEIKCAEPCVEQIEEKVSETSTTVEERTVTNILVRQWRHKKLMEALDYKDKILEILRGENKTTVATVVIQKEPETVTTSTSKTARKTCIKQDDTLKSALVYPGGHMTESLVTCEGRRTEKRQASHHYIASWEDERYTQSLIAGLRGDINRVTKGRFFDAGIAQLGYTTLGYRNSDEYINSRLTFLRSTLEQSTSLLDKDFPHSYMFEIRAVLTDIKQLERNLLVSGLRPKSTRYWTILSKINDALRKLQAVRLEMVTLDHVLTG